MNHPDIETRFEEEINDLHAVIILLWEVTVRHESSPYLIRKAREHVSLVRDLFYIRDQK